MNKKVENPRIIEANIFYLVIGLILIILGSFVQQREIYSGLIITEYVIILLPTLLYLKVRGYNLKTVLKLNGLSITQVLLIPLIVIFSYPVGAFLNSIMMAILSFFGEIKPLPIPIPKTITEFLINFLVIGLSAGICEEVMFRGFIMNSYKKLGVNKAVLISAILFGFFHFNIQNLLGPIFLGILFGYIVYKTNSIFSSILAHVTNNTIAITISYWTGKLGIQSESASEITRNMSYPLIMVIGSVVIGFIAVITGTIAFLLYRALPKSRETDIEEAVLKENEDYKEGLNFTNSIPLLVVGVIFIILTTLNIMNM